MGATTEAFGAGWVFRANSAPPACGAAGFAAFHALPPEPNPESNPEPEPEPKPEPKGDGGAAAAGVEAVLAGVAGITATGGDILLPEVCGVPRTGLPLDTLLSNCSRGS